MKQRTGCLGTLLLAAVWLGAAPMAAAQQASGSSAAPRGNAENGKKLFNTIGCWQCHGYSGQGGAGPKIAPDPVPYAGFLAYVRKPAGQMPPYSPKVIPDSDLADIYAYLQSVPKPPDPDSIPLLKNE